MKREWIFRILAVFVTAFIFSNSLKPAAASAEESGMIVAVLSRIFGWLGKSPDFDTMQNIVRKTAHFLEFALQGTLLLGCFRGKIRDVVIYVLFLGLLTGCVDEFLQLFFEGRGSQIQDVFIDFAGTIGGATFGSAVCFLTRRIK